MKIFLFHCLLLVIVFYKVQSNSIGRTEYKKSKERYLSLFTIVNFKNAECDGGHSNTGICYGNLECLNGGGEITGKCAGDYGVCCVTKISCGGSSGNNCTYLENPGYPDVYNTSGSCKQTIRIKPNVCQVRLDIEILDIVGPNSFGHCKRDYLHVNQDKKFEKVCGLTTDTHFYLEVMESTDLIFDFSIGFMTHNRLWRMKVCQICCDQEELVPCGCGQYYTGTSGIVKGFNTDASTSERYYLDGLNYAICIRKELDYCSTSYKEPKGFFDAICSDSFERPFSSTTSAFNKVCDVNPAIQLNNPSQISANFASDFMYIVSNYAEDDEHIYVDGVSASNIFIEYTQSPC